MRDQGCRSSSGGGPQDDHQAEGRTPEDRSGDIGDRAQERKSQVYRGLGMGALWDQDQAMRHGELKPAGTGHVEPGRVTGNRG